MKTYTQCEFQRENETTISWIPTSKAKINNIVNLKGENDEWTDGLVIAEVYNKVVEDIAIANRDAYRKHRDRTDI